MTLVGGMVDMNPRALVLRQRGEIRVVWVISGVNRDADPGTSKVLISKGIF